MRFASHRGIGFGAENTMNAVMAARAEGVTHVEVDVVMTSDGYLMLTHDPLQTSNDGKELYIPTVRRNELWDAGINLPELGTLVQLIDDNPILMVELKVHNLSDIYMSSLVTAVCQADLPEQTEILSFNPSLLYRLRKAGCPHRMIWNVVDPALASSLYLRDNPWIHAVNSHICWASVGEAQRFKHHKVKVGTYGVDDLVEGRKAATIGCDFVISADPTMLRGAMLLPR